MTDTGHQGWLCDLAYEVSVHPLQAYVSQYRKRKFLRDFAGFALNHSSLGVPRCATAIVIRSSSARTIPSHGSDRTRFTIDPSSSPTASAAMNDIAVEGRAANISVPTLSLMALGSASSKTKTPVSLGSHPNTLRRIRRRRFMRLHSATTAQRLIVKSLKLVKY
jgi:hypothetical protein